MVVLTSLVAINASAVTLICGESESNGLDHNLLREDISVKCKVAEMKMKGDIIDGRFENVDVLDVYDMTMDLKGFGPGMRWTLVDGFMVNCPLVFSTDRLVRSSFYGVKAEAGAFIGAGAGVFVNKRLGTCVSLQLELILLEPEFQQRKLNLITSQNASGGLMNEENAFNKSQGKPYNSMGKKMM